MTPQQERLLQTVNEKLSMLLRNQSRETWVKVHVVQRLTGWDKRDLQMARDENLVKFKSVMSEGENPKQIFMYVLESIPPAFLTRRSA